MVALIHVAAIAARKTSQAFAAVRYDGGMTNLYSKCLKAPFGRLVVVGTADGICRVSFPSERLEERFLWFNRHFSTLPSDEANPLVDLAVKELDEYFERRRQSFDLPLDLRGTPFQTAVWRELLKVPYGATVSYGELARRVGKPGGARAIGSVMAANPLPILVPCHRVVGHDQSLVGFGGGLSVKEQLLELEQARISFLQA